MSIIEQDVIFCTTKLNRHHSPAPGFFIVVRGWKKFFIRIDSLWYLTVDLALVTANAAYLATTVIYVFMILLMTASHVNLMFTHLLNYDQGGLYHIKLTIYCLNGCGINIIN